MMPSFDHDYVERVLKEVAGDLEFAAARQHLLSALTWRARDLRSPGFRFVRWIPGNLLARLCTRARPSSSLAGRHWAVTVCAPWGWRAEWEFDRDALHVMPAWIYYPRRWWTLARAWWYWRRR